MLLYSLLMVCCKHKPELPSPSKPTPPPSNQNSNIKDSVCFEGEILPLLTSGCAHSGCHDDISRVSGIDLSSYESVKSTISGNLLIQVIQDQSPLGMPLAPYTKLNASQIQLVQKWINEGMKHGIDCLGPCDTTAITYSGTIQPMLLNSCIGCHNGSSITDLSTYAFVKAQVDNGKLSCSVNYLNGCLPMPQNGPQLSACKLKQIKIWIDSGAPNN
jgi:hypothetical protein